MKIQCLLGICHVFVITWFHLSATLNAKLYAYLRKALFQAALVAAFNDPVFSAFYQKKRAEGKHHLTAVGAVARKMCNIIFAVLKNNTPYQSQ